MLGQPYSAEVLYGVPPSRQPSSTPAAEHGPGEVEPSMRTLPRSAAGALGNPLLVLVVLIGVAFLILNVSVRGQVSLGVSK